jgi:hypothetical protein
MSRLLLDTIRVRLDALETAVLGRARERLTKAEVAKREGISTRTVDRRVDEGKLPPPDDIINNRLYWWSDTLERHRRTRGPSDTAAARAARNPRLHKPARTSPET